MSRKKYATKRKKYPPYVAGQKVGKWTLLSRERGANLKYYWNTRCDCGRSGLAEEGNLRKGKSNHCLSCNPGRPLKKLTKLQHHYWTVEKPVVYVKTGGRKVPYMLARCVCGHFRHMRRDFFNGSRCPISCGCMRGFDHVIRLNEKSQRDQVDPHVLSKVQGAPGREVPRGETVQSANLGRRSEDKAA